MDFSNCTSFGGRKASPVDKGTDGVEVVDGRPGVGCCGFFESVCHQALMVCHQALMVCRPELALVAFCLEESVLVVCCRALELSGEVLAMSVACEHCRA